MWNLFILFVCKSTIIFNVLLCFIRSQQRIYRIGLFIGKTRLWDIMYIYMDSGQVSNHSTCSYACLVNTKPVFCLSANGSLPLLATFYTPCSLTFSINMPRFLYQNETIEWSINPTIVIELCYLFFAVYRTWNLITSAFYK